VLVEFTDTAGRPVQQDLGYDLEASAQRHLSLASLLLGDFDDARASSQRAVARAQRLPYVSPLLDALGWRAFMLYLLEEDGPEIDNSRRELSRSPKAKRWRRRKESLSQSADSGLCAAETLLAGPR
jgi:hypothetical protein